MAVTFFFSFAPVAGFDDRLAGSHCGSVELNLFTDDLRQPPPRNDDRRSGNRLQYQPKTVAVRPRRRRAFRTLRPDFVRLRARNPLTRLFLILEFRMLIFMQHSSLLLTAKMAR
jgi:hypothetical protein